MQKEKKVRIELPALDGTQAESLPIKFKKSKRAPTSHHFLVVPAAAPQISECVIDVKWNSVQKSLQLQVKENLHFDTYHWTELIKKTYAESQKGPFVDLEQDAILIHFLDPLGHEVSTLKFKELKLMNHQVNLSYDMDHGHLVHHVCVEYKEVEEIDISEFVDWSLMKHDDNEVSDEEWQTVEK